MNDRDILLPAHHNNDATARQVQGNSQPMLESRDPGIRKSGEVAARARQAKEVGEG